MQNLDQIAQDAAAAFASTDNPDTLEQIKARFLGKSGQITELLKGMSKLSPEERKTAGAAINRAKEAIEASLGGRREYLRRLALEKRLAEESLDITLPGRGETKGGLHPVTRTLERIEALFRSIGFEVAEGPEIEADFQNFTALNMPEDTRRVQCMTPSICKTRMAVWQKVFSCAPTLARFRCAICRRM